MPEELLLTDILNADIRQLSPICGEMQFVAKNKVVMRITSAGEMIIADPGAAAEVLLGEWKRTFAASRAAAADGLATPELRQRLSNVFQAALAADPICYGRVSISTVAFLVAEAIRAGEAMARKAAG